MNRPLLNVLRGIALLLWLMMCAGGPAAFVLWVCWASNILMLMTFLAGIWLDLRDHKPFRWINAIAMLLFYFISLIVCPVMMSAAVTASKLGHS